MEIFFTDLALLDGPNVVGARAPTNGFAPEHVDSLGIRPGAPFILGDGGEYDLAVNKFLRALPAMGARSPHTWRAYGYDILTWMRFLAECRGPIAQNGQPTGKTVWEADYDDVIAFHQQRRGSTRSSETRAVATSSWNRCIAALDKLYSWALRSGIIRTLPFTYRDARGGVRFSGHERPPVNTAIELGARHWDLRFLSLEQYRFFRRVGLLGQLPDGRDDPSHGVRNGRRNALMADFMLHTGARVREAGSFLDREIPTRSKLLLSRGQRSTELLLAPRRAKGARGRKLYASLRILDEFDGYRRVERAVALQRDRRDLEEANARGKLAVVTPIDGRSYRRAGRILRFADMTVEDVTRAYERREEDSVLVPAQMFLSETGSPMHVESWWRVFVEASRRCSRFGVDLFVTPHTLRHTFAVHYLTHRVRELIGELDPDQLRRETGRQVYYRLLSDPLRQLQLRLGHASIETTFIYLDSVAEAQFLVDDAFTQWLGDSRADLDVEEV
jgi:site-specific recombinase XerD